MCKLVPYKGGKLVADIKLDCINNIVEQAEKTKYISRIILFGSSLEERCNELSDIDIAVFGSKTSGSYLRSKEYRDFTSSIYKYDWKQDYDFLYFKEGKEYKEPVMRHINSGVEIYRRQ